MLKNSQWARYDRTEILLRSLLTALCAMGGSATNALAEILPRDGTFAGVYHRDLWGVGRFDFFLVNPRLHEQLKAFEGKNISLEVKNAEQPINPGPGIIQEIGEIRERPDSPLEIKLTPNYRRSLDDGLVEIVCYLRNRESKPLCASFGGFAFFSPRKVNEPDKPSPFMPVYTRRQMSITSDEGNRSLHGCFAKHQIWNGRPNLEHGHQVQLNPGEQAPFIARIRLSPGEYEVQVDGISEIDGKRLKPTRAWFRLDIPDKLPVGPEPEPRDLPEADLQLVDVEYLSPTQFAERASLSFTIRAAPGAKRSLVACTRGQEPLLAGLMHAFDGDGKELPLEVYPGDDCTNRGEAWQLTPVTRRGISTTVSFKCPHGQPKSFKLEIVTERGLAEFSIEP